MFKMIKIMAIKDFKELTANRQAVLAIIIVPLIFVVALPIILYVSVYFGGEILQNSSMNLKIILDKYPYPLPYQDQRLNMIFLSINYMFPAFFILIPVMAASVMGANSFVGEKEHKTMESLLYSPITVSELFYAKLVSSFIPAFLLTLFSFCCFAVVVNIGGWFYFHQLTFPNWKWLILIFWLSPALTLFSLSFIVLLSARCQTFMEAQQMSGFLVLPFVFVMAGQAGGLFLLNTWIIGISGLVCLAAGLILIRFASRGFIPEKLV